MFSTMDYIFKAENQVTIQDISLALNLARHHFMYYFSCKRWNLTHEPRGDLKLEEGEEAQGASQLCYRCSNILHVMF